MKPFTTPFASTLAGLLALGTGSLHAQSDELWPFSDEFDNAGTLGNFQRLFQVEGWGANHLETLDINTSTAGRLVMIPRTSSW